MNFKDIAIEAAKKAGEHSLINFQKIKNISYKEGKEIVTNVDKECEEIIKNSIFKNFPNHNYLGEETGKEENNSDYTWIVDPIDGTINYARGIKLYGISIALAKEKEIILGVVYNPITNEMFFAERGSGSYLNDKRINVSSVDDMGNALIYITAYNKMKEDMIKAIHKINNVRIITSTAYEICQIASGRVDGGYKLSKNCWGFSAACLIAEESGAKVTNFDGSKWNTDSRKLVIANTKIHDKLLKILQ